MTSPDMMGILKLSSSGMSISSTRTAVTEPAMSTGGEVPVEDRAYEQQDRAREKAAYQRRQAAFESPPADELHPPVSPAHQRGHAVAQAQEDKRRHCGLLPVDEYRQSGRGDQDGRARDPALLLVLPEKLAEGGQEEGLEALIPEPEIIYEQEGQGGDGQDDYEQRLLHEEGGKGDDHGSQMYRLPE